ncbi:MAG TPA: PorV/PorQ family protein [Elusimicrobiales bacterium]|nr:PorV/PorQ family protein [Elusimicrobiales bacterium]
MNTDQRQKFPAILLALGICTAGLPAARAGDYSAGALGTTGAQFLELPAGARAVALGDAQAAASTDASAIHYNPAQIAGLEGVNLSLTHAVYFQSVSYDHVSLAVETLKHGVLGFGAQYLSPGGIAKVDNAGNLTGDSLSPMDLAVSAYNARRYKDFEYGLGAKLLYSRLYHEALSYAGDGGVRWTGRSLTLAASFSNLGPGLKYRSEVARLPSTFRLGSSYRLGTGFLLAFDGIMARGAPAYGCAGLEYRKSFFDALSAALRAGYNGRTGAGKAGKYAGFSAGFGIGYKDAGFDYAYVPFGDLGNSHLLTLVMKFEKHKIAEKKASDAAYASPQSANYFETGSSAIIVTNRAILYKDPESTDSLGFMFKDSVVTVLGLKGERAKVSTSTGQTGWLRRAVLKLKSKPGPQ